MDIEGLQFEIVLQKVTPAGGVPRHMVSVQIRSDSGTRLKEPSIQVSSATANTLKSIAIGALQDKIDDI